MIKLLLVAVGKLSVPWMSANSHGNNFTISHAGDSAPIVEDGDGWKGVCRNAADLGTDPGGILGEIKRIWYDKHL